MVARWLIEHKNRSDLLSRQNFITLKIIEKYSHPLTLNDSASLGDSVY